MTNLYGRGRIEVTGRADEMVWHVYGPDGIKITALPSADLTMPGTIVGGMIAPHADTYAHALAVLGLTRAHRAAPALEAFRDDWDAGDPWGSGMAALGAMCDVLHMVERLDLVPEGSGYRPSVMWDPRERRTMARYLTMWMSAPEDDADEPEELDEYREILNVWRPLVAGRITLDDIATAARILSRYLDMVRAAGRDY